MQIVIPSQSILKFYLQIFGAIAVYLVQLYSPCGMSMLHQLIITGSWKQSSRV